MGSHTRLEVVGGKFARRYLSRGCASIGGPRCGYPVRLARGKIGGTIFGKGKGSQRAVCVFSE
jgi:hypothetical protein